MKRVGLVSLSLACAVAGTASAFALGAGGPLAATTSSSTVTTTTGAATGVTATTATTTTTTTTTTTAPPPVAIAVGVSIGGVPVGRLSPARATAVVARRFAAPLPIRYARLRFAAQPRGLAVPALAKAIARARIARPYRRIPLGVFVRSTRVRSYVDALARRIDRDAVDARLVLRHLQPYLTRDVSGRTLDRRAAQRSITKALRKNARKPVTLRATTIAPAVSRKTFRAPVIVIHRSTNHLYLYRGVRFWRTFQVATGQSAYPTPLGRFQIVVMWRNPWWYPPSSPWAQGAKPIPPGPGNPLGTRWMGLSAPGVGIHGTPDPASIGYSASHGCIRMRIPEAEWLFDNVEIGTSVFIVW